MTVREVLKASVAELCLPGWSKVSIYYWVNNILWYSWTLLTFSRLQAERGSAGKIDGIFRGSVWLEFSRNIGALHVWVHLWCSRQEKEQVRGKASKTAPFPSNVQMQQSTQKELLLPQWVQKMSSTAFRTGSLTLSSEILLHIKLSYLGLATEIAFSSLCSLCFL